MAISIERLIVTLAVLVLCSLSNAKGSAQEILSRRNERQRHTVDVSRLYEIEDAVLPATLVPGPGTYTDLPSYYAAANPELRARFERIRSLYEERSTPVYRGLTLVAGDAGIGKTFLKKEVFRKSYSEEAVLKIDLRELYLHWQQIGNVALKPDLHCDDVVINVLPSLGHTHHKPLLEMLSSKSASFIVLDSLDELHPDDYTHVIRQLEEFVCLNRTGFVHVVVFGRPFAFVDYWRSGPQNRTGCDIELFMLKPPRFRTTGDLLVSSWNYHTWKCKAKKRLTDGTTAALSLGDYAAWAENGFLRTKPFDNISVPTEAEIHPDATIKLLQYAQRHRMIGATIYNLAGNAIIREIMAQRCDQRLEFDEFAIEQAYFDAWLERDHASDNRPSPSHPAHLDLYIRLLQEVAVKYLVENHVDDQGFFEVGRDDRICVTHLGRELSFPVRQILNRSGMKHVDPCQPEPLKYRFEPIWLHRFLVEQYNRLGTTQKQLQLFNTSHQ
jgi:hypothetical protein